MSGGRGGAAEPGCGLRGSACGCAKPAGPAPGRGEAGERRQAGGQGEAGTREQAPPYQAAQTVLLRLHGERGGPGQYPASKVDAATQVQVLGLADGRRGGQGARIHYLGHGCG